MFHEESVLKFNDINQPDAPLVLDKKVQNFLEINDYLSKVLNASDLISDILELLDSEKKLDKE